MSAQDFLLGKCNPNLRARWLEQVRSYASHQSKPEIGSFTLPGHVTRHPFRRLGHLLPALRRVSGLALSPPHPDSRERYKIWEIAGEEYFPGKPSALLGQDLDQTFCDYLPSFRSRHSFILKIPQGLFHGHDHAVLDRNYNLIDWEPPYWATNCTLPGVMFRGRLQTPQKIAGRALVLSAPGATNNIWHLLFDSLPKLYLLELAGINPDDFDFILVNSRQANFEKDAFEILGLGNNKIIETDEWKLIQADELFFVSLGCLIPPDPWVLSWLRSKFITSSNSVVPHKRIFLSRSDASRRRLQNEQILWEHLSKDGFMRIEFSSMSLLEQITCMNECSAIVAPHGAGLTNLVWAKTGTRVVELFSCEYITACYWLIAEMLQLDYAFAIGERTMKEEFHNRAILEPDRLAADIYFSDLDSLADQICFFVNQ